ncbi:hypothetical protein [Bradyrhizobium sp.]|uniref:hypothetical protein n=1 Tax=Bradyrhizobium sp. TaxID=376 RepID=UPI0039E23080
MIDHSHILTRLIAAGELALQMRFGADAEEIQQLCAEVEKADRQPAETARVIDDVTRLYAQALYLTDHALRRYQRDRAICAGRVVAVLLPDVRNALGIAIEQRKTRLTP